MTRNPNKDISFMILSTHPNKDDQIIRGSKLPTYKQVLLFFLSLKNQLLEQDKTNSSKVFRAAANETVEQVIPFYQRGNIPFQCFTQTKWPKK